ncbi:carboxypeptidase-like regulatory domain-containing protein [Frondihabitans peucedani]|uniref:carboxypeptidase-like regulatory domain-containing protein n=1 Tax=Frondihabitans peucedani TaxID=598626 RepID=UPI0031D4B748
MKASRTRTGVTAVLAALVLAALPAQTAQATPGHSRVAAVSAVAAAPGSISVQLVDIAGDPLALAGATASVYVSSPDDPGFRRAATDSSGHAVISDLPATPYYDLTIDPPKAGSATYAPTRIDSVGVAAGVSTVVSATLARGATVTGRLTGPTGAPLAGTKVTIEGMTYVFPEVETTTDATGRYTFVGLASDVYELFTGDQIFRTSLSWMTRAHAERPGVDPSRVTLSTRLVHTAYDIGIGVDPSADGEATVGATVTLTNVSTGATFTQRTGGVAGVLQPVKFAVPTGDYTISVRTVATAATPSRTWWYTGQRTKMTADAGSALRKHIDFSSVIGIYAKVP